MKTFKHYLHEVSGSSPQRNPKSASRQTSTRDTTKPIDLTPLGTDNLPISKQKQKQKSANREEPQAPVDPRRKVNQANTLKATSNIQFTPDMAAMLSNMKQIDFDDEDEDEGYPEPTNTTDIVTTTNLPAVANTALRAAGIQNPDWHQVANLPGNMGRSIRMLGKHLFGSFTRTSTADIYVVANLGGTGPNSTQEVNAVAGWLRNEGKDLGPGEIDFSKIMPGYNADIHQYSAAGIRWFLVRDDFGQYIYSWPEEDSKTQKNNTAISDWTNRIK